MNAFRWIDLFGLVQIELLKMNILGSLLQSKVLKMNVLGSLLQSKVLKMNALGSLLQSKVLKMNALGTLLQSKVLKMNALGSLLQSSSQNERFGQSFTEQSSQSEWFWLAWMMRSSSDRCFQKYRFRLAWLTHFLRNEYVSQNGCLNWLSRTLFSVKGNYISFSHSLASNGFNLHMRQNVCRKKSALHCDKDCYHWLSWLSDGSLATTSFCFLDPVR